uniref:Putative ovule protein n=1 Tax=Solanum chacoense TaxID=4108 RepID=A0A0V0H351_SOLCH
MTIQQAVKEKRELIIRGTKRYMAAELLHNYDYGPHVDILALGCTVYEFIKGTTCWTCVAENRVGETKI